MKIPVISISSKKLFLGTLVIISSILTATSNVGAVTLRVSIENLAPENGQGIAPVWFGLHDGSFDLFDEGNPASIAIESLAEDGLTGNPQGRIPPDFVADFVANGADLTQSPAPENILTGSFATSQAALNGGYQDLLFFDRRVDPYFGVQLAGETTTTTFTLEGDLTNNRFFSYAGMVFPSNDAFIGNDDPTAIEIFDAQGNFVGAEFVVLGSDVWDAGTEVNDENPINVPYELENIFNSIDENSVVRQHPGLLPPGSGGIVDFEFNGEQFVNADFAADGYQVARITVTQVSESESVPESSTNQGLLFLAGWLALQYYRRR